MVNAPPLKNEIELTIIGTGGGYGESIVIKLAYDEWIIVDSCVDPKTQEPLALWYLNELKINLDFVKLIVCTHWHNDHIRGLSKILSKCLNAELCIPSVNDLKNFLYLCGLDAAKSKKGSKASLTEFSRCLDISKERNIYITKSQADQILYRKEFNNVIFNIYSLSPSPKTLHDFDQEVKQLITDFGQSNTAVVNKSPNEKSVALLITFNNERVILGSDLEIGKSEHEGWNHIVNYSKVLDTVKSKLYKVPHHGSENAYREDIFNKIVNENATLKLTPYRSQGLPTAEMLEKYSGHTNSLFLTSQMTHSSKAKKRDKSIEKQILRSVKNISEIKYQLGIVQSRLDYTSDNPSWNTVCLLGGIMHKKS